MIDEERAPGLLILTIRKKDLKIPMALGDNA